MVPDYCTFYHDIAIVKNISEWIPVTEAPKHAIYNKINTSNTYVETLQSKTGLSVRCGCLPYGGYDTTSLSRRSHSQVRFE